MIISYFFLSCVRNNFACYIILEDLNFVTNGREENKHIQGSYVLL